MYPRLEPLSDSIVQEKLQRHNFWRNGFAQLWSGWQFNISNYNCQGYNFHHVGLREMVGSFAMMRNCQFFMCDICYGKFNTAIMDNVSFSQCNLAKVYMPCARLDGSSFRSCQLYGADLRMAKMKNVNMYACDMAMCNFQDAELEGADLRYSNVVGCNFKGTCLDFSGTNKIPAYCYCQDQTGKTIMLVTGYPQIYELPEFMQRINPMELNAAYGISLERVNQLVACFNHSWMGLKPQMTFGGSIEEPTVTHIRNGRI